MIIYQERKVKMEKLVCEDCGTTKDVTKGICPYQQDVNNEEVEAILCDKCYYERCQDI